MLATTRVLVRFATASTTIEHNATSLKLAGGSNYTTSNANAIFEFYTPDGTNWVELWHED